MPAEVSLVTGAAGFIGAHLCKRLLARGEKVHALVRPSTRLDRLDGLLDALTFHRVDLVDAAGLQAALAAIAPTCVYHLAAQTRPETGSPFIALRRAAEANLSATLTLVEALTALATPPRVMIRAATIAEYGPADMPCREDALARPATAYGAGMLATTAAIGVLTGTMPFPVINARLALCYGAGQSRAFLVAEAVDALLAGRPITLTRPEDRRDLIHVEDAVSGLVALADTVPADCPIVNIASGIAPRMDDVMARICDLAGADPRLLRVTPAAPGNKPSVLHASPELARRRLGWHAAITLEDGLRHTIAAHRAAHEASLPEVVS
ncbi:NAD(P)-dependent oxidoreductase [Novosphingobium sp. YJ-S2-02]|uniref:NAD(P)-dependent oxidoreductase n=1 Tax=Novosphingobium aureum TaxID=2792964 RepID=A0A931HDE0_9SPHN|nr:NAD(P)-dependent oxidoreductase [Novosphingobium aureum]MBH0113719.1 NAD(P)-dependent oxidoreductase [Novosphingobium aureum]